MSLILHLSHHRNYAAQTGLPHQKFTAMFAPSLPAFYISRIVNFHAKTIRVDGREGEGGLLQPWQMRLLSSKDLLMKLAKNLIYAENCKTES